MKSDRVRKTFDCDYGRHALVIQESKPAAPLPSGRVDVLKILEENGGARLHPSRIAPGYVPTHRKGQVEQ